MKSNIQNRMMKLRIVVYLLFVVISTVSIQIKAQSQYQPEFTSFESISTTDMVNLSTGDFTYSIPLVNVPGPEGGFSMPLSYHAGIKLNQEASWVGLGWSLNPGAINRTISQFPDDFNGDESYYALSHHNGGVLESLYLPKVLTGLPVDIGVSWDSDEGYGGTIGYKGLVTVGVGTQAGLEVMGVSMNSQGVNVDPVGVATSMVSLAAGIKDFNKGLYGTPGKIANTLSTGYTGYSLGQAFSGLGDRVSNLNNWTVKSKDYLLYKRKRYFLHHAKRVGIYGLLYLELLSSEDDFNYDIDPSSESVYSYNLSQSNENSKCGYFHKNAISDGHIYSSEDDYAYQMNPTSLAIDRYDVSAAGVSGNIAPYRTDIGSLALTSRNTINYNSNTDHLMFKPIGFRNNTLSKTNFRYVGDASNYYDYATHFDENALGFTRGLIGNTPFLDWEIGDEISNYKHIYGNRDYSRNQEEYNATQNHLSSGKNIKWYTNKEITNGTAKGDGFIDFTSDYQSDVFRAELPEKGIGGFTVTNIDGMTYHFALPVYNFSKTDYYSTNLNKNYSISMINKPFATSWLLTAITGPDYLSRGDDGAISDQDWGYWVKFEYGKFSEVYLWRYPYYDMSYSDQEDYKGAFSSGDRESYYLNTIKTRTHTAYFVKKLREDGRSAYLVDEQIVKEDVDQGGILDLFLGGSAVLALANELHSGVGDYIEDVSNTIYNELFDNNNDMYLEHNSYSVNPSSSLALKEIIIVKNGEGTVVSGYQNSAEVIDSDNFSNVLDENDFNTITPEGIIKRIEFITDYSLCQGTPSSFSSAITPPEPGEGSGGKLTLNEVKVYENNDIQLIPSYTFEYGDNPNYKFENWDGWGMYKSNGRESKDGHTSTSEGEQWSLNKITTPLGGVIEVDYERDMYSSVSGQSNYIELPVKSVIDNNTIELYSSDSKIDDFLNIGDGVELNLIYKCLSNEIEYNSNLTISDVSPFSITFNEVLSAELVEDLEYNNICEEVEGFGWSSTTIEGVLEFKSGKIKIWDKDKFGGDIRVSSLVVKDELSNEYKTEYIYTKNGDVSGVSSGVVPVEPPYINDKKRDFERFYDYPKGGVIYENVTVLNGVTNVDDYLSKDEYKFIVPHSSMISSSNEDISTVSDEQWKHRLLTLDINTNSIGKLRSVNNYNSTGIKTSTTIYNYGDDTDFDKLGLYTEATIFSELIEDNFDYQYVKLFITKKFNHPSILKSVTINKGGVVKEIENTKYDLVTGNVLETKYQNSLGEKYRTKSIPAYHKYPQMGSKALNPMNKNMMSQKAADYLYSTNDLGEEKVVSASVQTWSDDWTYRDYSTDNDSYAYHSEENSNIWRKHKTYAWNSPHLNEDGTYDDFEDFDWESSTQNSNWLSLSENILYDHYSKPLEIKDVNGNYSSTKVGYGTAKTLLTSSSSRFTESYYSGAEDKIDNGSNYFGGEVRGSDKQSSEFAHTGSFSIATNKSMINEWIYDVDPGTGSITLSVVSNVGFEIEGSIGENEDFSIQDYIASVWVYSSTVENARLIYEVYNDNSLEYTSEDEYLDVEIIRANDWSLKQILIPIEKLNLGNRLKVLTKNSSQQTGITCYFDDFRLHPLESTMNSYVYDRWGNLVAVLDENNIATRYTYDDAGRLKSVEREFADDANGVGGFKKVKSSEYHYAREIE